MDRAKLEFNLLRLSLQLDHSARLPDAAPETSWAGRNGDRTRESGGLLIEL